MPAMFTRTLALLARWSNGPCATHPSIACSDGGDEVFKQVHMAAVAFGDHVAEQHMHGKSTKSFNIITPRPVAKSVRALNACVLQALPHPSLGSRGAIWTLYMLARSQLFTRPAACAKERKQF